MKDLKETTRYHVAPAGTATIKIIAQWKDWRGQNPRTLLLRWNMVQLLWKTIWWLLKKHGITILHS
jgi:hypothetical protein